MTTIHTDVSASTPAAQEPPARHAAAKPGRRSEFRLLSFLGHVALVCWALIVLLPIAWTFISSLKTGPEITPLCFAVKSMGNLPVIGPWIGLDTRGGLILVYIAYSLPFTVFFLAAFFKTLPDSIAEAAIMDGASHTRLFFRVMLPMARSGIVSITIFNILGQWNQYLLPIALLQGQGAEDRWVLTQGIANISTSAGYESDWPALFAALTIAI